MIRGKVVETLFCLACQHETAIAPYPCHTSQWGILFYLFQSDRAFGDAF